MTAGQEDGRTGRQEDRRTAEEEVASRRHQEEVASIRRGRRKTRIMIRTGLCLLLCLTSLHGEKVGT